MIELSKDVTVDPNQIERVLLVKKGAKIGARIATMPASRAEELLAPEDELVVHMRDGSASVIRGEQQSKQAWDALHRVREEQHLSFAMSINDRQG